MTTDLFSYWEFRETGDRPLKDSDYEVVSKLNSTQVI